MNFDPRLLRLLSKSKLAFTITIALGLTGGALALWQARSFARIVDQVFLKEQGFLQVYPGLLALLAVILIRTLNTWGYDSAGGAISKPIKRHLRHKLYQHILMRGPVFTSQESTGELVNTAIEGVEVLDAYYSQYIPQVILAALIPLSFLAFIAPVDWISALVMLITAPLIPFFMALIGQMAQLMTRRQWLSLSRMSAYFLDVLQGLPTLKTLGRSQEQGEVIAHVSQRYADTTMGVLRVAFLSALTLELVATLSTAVVAVQLGVRLLYGWISFEQALFVLALAPEFYLPLRMLGTRFHAGMAGVEAGKRVFQVLSDQVSGDQVSGVQVSSDKVSGGKVTSEQASREQGIEKGESEKRIKWKGIPGIDEKQKLLPTIHFRDVKFEYEPGRGIINGVSFSIVPGEKIALVGASGAGKSTLISLLMGFLMPNNGEILVGDVPISEISPEIWRGQIAWIPQKPYLFRDSIAANIRLANPQASREALVKAARLAHADEFIRVLPQGYETVIGERGARLSAGQAQRIALARAFLKDAPLLILDEGTAHLDAGTASQVQEAIQQLSVNRTVITIAHQLSTVRQADRILVMDKGKIVQSGRHVELTQQEGPYRQLLDSDINQQRITREIESFPKIDSLPLVNDNFSPITNYYSQISTHYSPLTLLNRLIRLILPYSGWITLSALLGFATVASSVGLAATSAYIISAAALQPSIAVLQVAIVGVRFFGLSRGVFRYLERYVSHKVTLQVLGRLRVWFYEALEPLAPARLLMHHSGDLLSRIIGDISSLENFYVRALYPPLVAILVAVLLGAYLGMFSAQLAVEILLIFLGACVAIPWLMNYLAKSQGKQVIEKRAELSERLVEDIQGLADLLIYGQEQHQTQRIDNASRDLEASHQKMTTMSGLQNGLMGLFSNLSLWAVLMLAIPMVDVDLVPGVYLAGLALAALAGFEATTPLPMAGQYLGSNLQAARRLFELVDAKPEVVDPPDPLPPPHRFDLEIKGLSFYYPQQYLTPPIPFPDTGEERKVDLTPPTPLPDTGRGEQRPLLSPKRGEKGDGGMREVSPPPFILRNISFSLPHGKHIAIVGTSGAGKTTLINLLLRFWDYRQGSILLGGSELRQYRPNDLRKMMAVVSQDTYLFNATLRENLLLARPNASPEQLMAALVQAQLEDLVGTLPEGLDTWLGEQGVQLSAGERQRVSIARALLKDAPILILDEATANLDAQTKQQVMSAIERAMKGRSVIMVTHHQVGLEAMDQVLILSE